MDRQTDLQKKMIVKERQTDRRRRKREIQKHSREDRQTEEERERSGPDVLTSKVHYVNAQFI